MKRHAKAKRLMGGLAVTAIVFGVAVALVLAGVIWPNRWFSAGHPIRGLDVSTYQGTVDWQAISRAGVDFVYIKATEGSSSVDDRFVSNWAAAHEAHVTVGAYHFVSVDSTGGEQAANIARTVPREAGDLRIAVDLECYADYCAHPPAASLVHDVLKQLMTNLEVHYGYTPVIYANQDWYDRYLAGSYDSGPIWIRSIVIPPGIVGDVRWAFWQWSDKERYDGYDGSGEFIDADVFGGTLDEFRSLITTE